MDHVSKRLGNITQTLNRAAFFTLEGHFNHQFINLVNLSFPVSLLDTLSAVALSTESESTDIAVVSSPSGAAPAAFSWRLKVSEAFVTVVPVPSCTTPVTHFWWLKPWRACVTIGFSPASFAPCARHTGSGFEEQGVAAMFVVDWICHQEAAPRGKEGAGRQNTRALITEKVTP